MNSTIKSNEILIRKAKPDDVPVILKLIKELADYEKLSDEVEATEEKLMNTIFSDDSYIEVWFAELNDEIAGHVFFFRNYSTFLAKPGLYIEELYVRPQFRAKGIGKKLLVKVIQLARQKNYGRVEWAVLNWNEPAIEFYKKIGSVQMDEWTLFRLTEDKFDSFE
jgi:GNAT superfamily N-acetyltransferase